MIVSRREFLRGFVGVGLVVTGCDFLTRRREVSKEQRVAELERVAREIVSGKYSWFELEISDSDLDIASAMFSFRQQPDVNPLIIDVANRYDGSGRLEESLIRLAGGLNQPEVKALADYKVSKGLGDERIKVDGLEKAARALLNFSSRAGFKVTKKVDYVWGEVEAVAFTDTTSSGGRMLGYLDAKGRGKIQILHIS